MSTSALTVPDFAIVGGPKCGTTALYTYLATHPGIAMSSRKEPYFWSPDIRIRSPLADPADYARLWADAPPETLKGEASPSYLRSSVAIPAILDARPDARFIAMLRPPAAMAASLHTQMVVDLQEDVASFEKAWRLQEARAAGRHVPRLCDFPPNLQYRDVCALGSQLERALAIVPRAQMHVILYDDLRADPQGVYRAVLRFLCLADDGRTSFAPVNRSKWRRALPLVQLTRRIATGGATPLNRLAGSLHAAIERLSLTERSRPAPSEAFDREIHEFFRPQVDKIGQLVGRDLSHWSVPAPKR